MNHKYKRFKACGMRLIEVVKDVGRIINPYAYSRFQTYNISNRNPLRI